MVVDMFGQAIEAGTKVYTREGFGPYEVVEIDTRWPATVSLQRTGTAEGHLGPTGWIRADEVAVKPEGAQEAT